MGRTITLRPQNFSSNAPGAKPPAVGFSGDVFFGGDGSLRDNSDSTNVQVGSINDTSSARVDYLLDDAPLAANERFVDMRYRARRRSTSGATDADVTAYFPSDNSEFATQLPLDTSSTSYSEAAGAYFAPSAAYRTQARLNEMRYRIHARSGTSARPEVSEGYIDIRTNYAPTANDVGPAGDQETTGLAATWTTFDSEGDAQAGYQVRLFTAAQYQAPGFDPSTSTATFDTGDVLGAANSHDLPSPLATGDYRVYVRLRDLHGFGTWSYAAFAANDFLTVDAGLGVEGFEGEVLNLDATVTGTQMPPGFPSFWALPSRSPAGTVNAAVSSVTLDVGTGDGGDLVSIVAAARAQITDMTAPAPWSRISFGVHTADDITLGIWTARRRDITDTTPTVTFTGTASQHAAAVYVARPKAGRDVSVVPSVRRGSGVTDTNRWTVEGNATAAGVRTLTLPIVVVRPAGAAAASDIDEYDGFTERLDMGAEWVSLVVYDLPFEGAAAAWGGFFTALSRWISLRLTIVDQALAVQPAASRQWTGENLVFGTPTAEDTTVRSGTPGLHVATLTANGLVTDSTTVRVMETPPAGSGLLPVLTVEIDGRSTPSAWTDPGNEWVIISGTNPLRRISTREGQRSAYGPCEPGRIESLTLSNDNGYLDKSNATSPYKSYLTEGRQIRVRTGGLELARGNVESWPQEWESFVNPTITLSLTDVLGELGRTSLAQTLFEHAAERGVDYPKPAHLWPGTEKITGADASIADVIGGLDYTPTGAPPSASGSQLVPYSDIAGVQGNRGPASTPGSAPIPSTFPDDNGPWTLFGVVAAPGYQDNVSTSTSPFSCRTNGVTDTKFWPAILTNTVAAKIIAYLRIENTAGTRTEASGTLDHGNQSPVLIFVRHDPTIRTVSMRVENLGLPNAPETLTATYGGDLSAFNPTDLFLLMAGTPGTSAAMTAVWPVRLTDAQIDRVSADISAPWRGDNADERLAKLLDIATPGVDRNLDVASEEMLPVSLTGSPALEVIRRTVDSTSGKLWAQAGRVEFRNRDHAPAPVAAFGVGGIPIQKLTLTDGSEDRATHITVENEAGSRRVYNDASAKGVKGERRLTIETALRYSNDMVALGQRTAERRSAAKDYVSSITTGTGTDGVDIVKLLRIRLYDRITVAFARPWDSSTVETQTLEVVARNHDGDAGGNGAWSSTFGLRPV